MGRRKSKIKFTPQAEQFIIEHLKREWLKGEKSYKKYKLIKKAEEAGVIFSKTLLTLLLVSGIVTIATVAPNAFAAFGPGGRFRRFIKTSNFKGSINYGSKKSYWKYRKIREGEYRVELTPYGKKIALKAALKNMQLGKQEKWDGKWRMVIFDIPRKRNHERDVFRKKLEEIGMLRIQESVFVYPYPCEEEVMFLASLFNISQDVQILEAKFLSETDNYLKKKFEL
jgi:hypothetical protein